MRLLLALLAALATTPLIAAAQPIPQAVIADPAPDKDNPARFFPFALPTHGVNINALIYVAQGPGPHPTVILFHGIPGAENNLDLAQAIRRAGWNVVTLHYRGSWGSPGQYGFAHCLEDAQAAVAWVRDPKTVAAKYIDPSRIVVAGHSLGGFVAGYTAAHDPGLLGAALISSAGFRADMAEAPRPEMVKGMAGEIQDQDGLHMLGDVTPESLADELIANARDWDLSRHGPALARKPLLVITANDGLRPFDDSIAAAAEAQPGAKVTRVHFDTNHNYNDHRIALAGALVTWLQSLPASAR